MKKLLIFILATLLLAGCTPAPDSPETTAVPTLSETTAAPETTVAPDPMEMLLSGLTLEQKVGQLFIVSPEQVTGGDDVTAMTDELEAGLVQYPVGGIILFAQNIQSPEQLIALNGALADMTPISPFLAVDEEGGIVARLGNHEAFELPTYQSAGAVGSSGNPEDALQMGLTIGGYLQEYGFNLDFAPVADVNTNPSNPVIGTRAFSDQPEIAAQMAAAFSDGLREQGIIATFKHFPGHGDTDQDSHSGLAVSYKTREQLENCEWIPFQAASGMDFVMTAHVALPEITGDMIPATLSREIVTGILREELGFKGLITTDAMNMGAIVETYGSAEAAVMALQAGCDIILKPENLPEAFDAVIAALEDGRLTMEWLDNTVRRILDFKEAHGILKC